MRSNSWKQEFPEPTLTPCKPRRHKNLGVRQGCLMIKTHRLVLNDSFIMAHLIGRHLPRRPSKIFNGKQLKPTSTCGNMQQMVQSTLGAHCLSINGISVAVAESGRMWHITKRMLPRKRTNEQLAWILLGTKRTSMADVWCLACVMPSNLDWHRKLIKRSVTTNRNIIRSIRSIRTLGIRLWMTLKTYASVGA